MVVPKTSKERMSSLVSEPLTRYIVEHKIKFMRIMQGAACSQAVEHSLLDKEASSQKNGLF